MGSTEMFNVLESIDSTNNYAMAMVHAGMAKHGMAWFAQEQTAGRGQRGRSWESEPGQNIALSITIQPREEFFQNQFFFSALVANACYDFFYSLAGDEVSIKWPNDIYWRDRKAGGILIENRFMGNTWKWAVAGIGMNINQVDFNENAENAVSLKQITGLTYDPQLLAIELHKRVLAAYSLVVENDFPGILDYYNGHLFQKNNTVLLKKGTQVFETRITGVNGAGQLLTSDSEKRSFEFGEVEWMKKG